MIEELSKEIEERLVSKGCKLDFFRFSDNTRIDYYYYEWILVIVGYYSTKVLITTSITDNTGKIISIQIDYTDPNIFNKLDAFLEHRLTRLIEGANSILTSRGS